MERKYFRPDIDRTDVVFAEEDLDNKGIKVEGQGNLDTKETEGYNENIHSDEAKEHLTESPSQLTETFYKELEKALSGENEENEGVNNGGNYVYKEVNIHGEINTEIDIVDLEKRIIYEDKSAHKLYMETVDFPQTEQQWAFKQIYRKGSNRIDAINQSKYTLSIVNSENVPNIDFLKNIRNYVFRIDADTPALRQAVEQCLDKLRAKYPGYNFSATYGGK